MQVQIASSLDKIFPNIAPTTIITQGTMLKNERYHLQLCLFNDTLRAQTNVKVEVQGSLKQYCSFRAVDYVPAQKTKFETWDDYYIFQDDHAGIYPDLLRPFENGDVIVPANQWKSVWCTIFCEKGLQSGQHNLRFVVTQEDGTQTTVAFAVEVIDACLPKSDLLYTNWFHYDCIAQYYHVKPWSKKYYRLLGSFIDSAVSHGVNIIYTPIFTPPLDTNVGGERQDVQLVSVAVQEDGKYAFDFTRLNDFFDFCMEKGIEYFEISHLATQWGATACPKIMAQTQNGYQRIFGWDTPSLGEEYKTFLSQFLPELYVLIRNKGIENKVFFHVSDETKEEDFDGYCRLTNYIKQFIGECKIIDATAIFAETPIDIPVVATTHAADCDNPNSWVYYCVTSCDQYLSNRFFNMPSQRNRILGMQLYQQDKKGFLHWGFNFYNTILSYRGINPFTCSDAGGGFPAGDAFVVYPGQNGALDSLRLEVFYDGLQDRMALKLLERYLGRSYVLQLLNEEGVRGWSEYPHSTAWHVAFRDKINGQIARAIQNEK